MRSTVSRPTQILLFCSLFLAAALFYHPLEYDNTISRYLLVEAIVDHGEVNIDRNHARTVDKSLVGGHYYSCKAIGASLLGVPVYWALRNFTPIHWDPPTSTRAKYLIRILTTSLPFAILGLVLFHVAMRLGAIPRAAFRMVLAYGFGSIALLHASLFSGHQIAACFSFFAFSLLLGKDSPWRYSIAGLFVGLAVLCDFVAICGAMVLSLFALAKRSSGISKIAFLSGGLACALVLGAYNKVSFGDPFVFSYSNLPIEAFQKGHAQGLLGVSWPRAAPLLQLLIWPSRGLFFIMPVFLLSVVGLIKIRKGMGNVFWVCVSIALLTLFFNAGYYNWHGGWTYGPRLLVTMLPFLALPMAFAVDRRGWFAILLALSFMQVGLAQAGLPHVSERIQNPIPEYILPLLQYGYTAYNPLGLLWLGGTFSGLWVLLLLLMPLALAYHSLPQPEPEARIAKRWQVIFALWIVMVVGGLTFVRTDPQVAVHVYRARALGHAAEHVGPLKGLQSAANYEKTLGE